MEPEGVYSLPSKHTFTDTPGVFVQFTSMNCEEELMAPGRPVAVKFLLISR